MRRLFTRSRWAVLGVVVCGMGMAVVGTARVPSHAAVARGDGAIGVVGCSNTLQAVAGYRAVSDKDRLVDSSQRSETVVDWAESGDPWVRYDRLRPPDGYAAVWLNLCEQARVGISRENAERVLDKIWLRDPGVAVYVSPLNFYETGRCRITNGNAVPREGATLADGLAETFPDVFRGPDLGPLDADALAEDHCHLSPAGQQMLGAQLVDFFDGQSPAKTTTTASVAESSPPTTAAPLTSSSSIAPISEEDREDDMVPVRDGTDGRDSGILVAIAASGGVLILAGLYIVRRRQSPIESERRQ